MTSSPKRPTRKSGQRSGPAYGRLIALFAILVVVSLALVRVLSPAPDAPPSSADSSSPETRSDTTSPHEATSDPILQTRPRVPADQPSELARPEPPVLAEAEATPRVQRPAPVAAAQPAVAATEPETALEPDPPATAVAPPVASASEADEALEGADDEDADSMVWTIDRDGIKAAMKDSRPKLKECYAAWQKADETLGGKLVVSFTVVPQEPEREGEEPFGRIAKVQIPDSELDHALLEGCVLNVLTGLKWTAPDNPITVNYPFRFSAAPEDEAP